MSEQNVGQGGNTSGRSLVDLDFTPGRKGDCIPDGTLAELVRRLNGTVAADRDGATVISPTPPINKNAIWIPVDPETLNRSGPNRRYDFSIGRWVDDVPDFQEFCAIEGGDNLLEQVGGCWQVRRRLSQRISIAVTENGQQELELDQPVSGANYAVTITPTSDPANVKVWVANRLSQQVTIQTSGHSSGTQNFEVTILELN